MAMQRLNPRVQPYEKRSRREYLFKTRSKIANDAINPKGKYAAPQLANKYPRANPEATAYFTVEFHDLFLSIERKKKKQNKIIANIPTDSSSNHPIVVL